MILLGIPHFVTKQSLFKTTGQNLCVPQRKSTVAIHQVSRKSNRSFTGTSRTSAISKVYSEKSMFSIWCLNIADMCTAEVGCLCQFCLCKSTKFAIISNGQTEKSKLIHAFVVHIPAPFSIKTDASPVFLLAYSRIYRKETI